MAKATAAHKGVVCFSSPNSNFSRTVMTVLSSAGQSSAHPSMKHYSYALKSQVNSKITYMKVPQRVGSIYLKTEM